MRLAIFDLDHTLLAGDSDHLWGEFMIEQGMPPESLGAAGYADQDPVAPNDSEPNKELNRRIEIILVPNLSELPQLTVDQP